VKGRIAEKYAAFTFSYCRDIVIISGRIPLIVHISGKNLILTFVRTQTPTAFDAFQTNETEK